MQTTASLQAQLHKRVCHSDQAPRTIMTVVVIVFVILIEVAIHACPTCLSPRSVPQDPETDTNTGDIQHSESPPPDANALLTDRKLRLLVALMLLFFIIGPFAFLMSDFASQIHPSCDQSPNWPFVVFLNILPFACAVFAMLRLFVDCILLSRGYKVSGDMWPRMWTPCIPFFCVVVLGLVVCEAVGEQGLGIVRGARGVSRGLFGVRERDYDGEVEMVEEVRWLVGDGDGDVYGEEEDGELPAYEAVGGTKEGEGKIV